MAGGKLDLADQRDARLQSVDDGDGSLQDAGAGHHEVDPGEQVFRPGSHHHGDAFRQQRRGHFRVAVVDVHRVPVASSQLGRRLSRYRAAQHQHPHPAVPVVMMKSP